MITKANPGHPGGMLSAADIVTLLYFKEMNIDPSDPKKKDRDRFMLPKGHAAPILYATMAIKRIFSERRAESSSVGRSSPAGGSGYETYPGS